MAHKNQNNNHSSTNYYEHWSGYSIDNYDYSSMNNYGNSRSGRYNSISSSSSSPPSSYVRMGSPPKSLSSSPCNHESISSNKSTSSSTGGNSTGGHSSRKLDSIFRHLVKWSSPNKDKEKRRSSASNAEQQLPIVELPSNDGCEVVKQHTSRKSQPIYVVQGRSRSRSNSHHHNNEPSHGSIKGRFSTTPVDSPTAPISITSVNSTGSSNGRRRTVSEGYQGNTGDESYDTNQNEMDDKDEDLEEDEHIYDRYLIPCNRVRSNSLDYATSRQYIRNRRLSGDIPNRCYAGNNYSSNETYTIYEGTTSRIRSDSEALSTPSSASGSRRGSLHSHRPSDVQLDPAHAAILFRDSRGLPHSDPFVERFLSLSTGSEEEQNGILVKFFKFHKCYDLIPTSAKLVVFDTQLLVKKAFFALVYNGVRAAPLWDSEEKKMVGMLTITDFIRVLHAMYHDSAGTGSKMSELEEHRVDTWRKRFLLNKKPLISIDPDASLYDAICSLISNRIHRLPVIETSSGNVLHILTHKRILKFLFLYIHEIPGPQCLNKPLRELCIGTFESIETAREDTPIIAALQKFIDRRVSALPIVDEQNRLLDIYAKFDVINLAAEKTYNNLEITLKQANEHRNEWFEGVHKCTLDDTLSTIMEKIVKAEVHRLVVVDECERVVGVISLSDILEYLVMRPELKDVTVSDIEESFHSEEVTGTAGDNPGVTGNEESPKVSEENDQDKTESAVKDNPTIFEEDEKL